jgi:branched-subunit amino acid transport protein
MTTWVVVLAAGVATYAVRISMVVVLQERPVPGWLEPVLALAGPAVLAAIVGAAVAAPNGTVDPPPAATVIALGAAAFVVRRTDKPALALAVGLPIAWVAHVMAWG